MICRTGLRVLLTALLVLLAVAIGGTASAFWSGAGAGTGSSTTGTVDAVTLTPGTPAANLHPGGVADVVLTASNPNASDVHIGSLVLDLSQGTDGFAVDADHSACALTTFSFATQTNSGAGWTVPAGAAFVDGTLEVGLVDALSMSEDAADACQGAITTIYLTVGP